MRLNSLSLYNFRNFVEAGVVEFPEAPLLVAIAPNATGKTNFLEAISVLLRGKSFRASHADCVRWGEDTFVVRGEVEAGGEPVQLAVQYQKSQKSLRVEEEGSPVSPVTFYQQYPYVLFLPEDAFLFERGPAMRRNFFNTTLVGGAHYLAAVVQYQRVLRQRNAALKTARSAEDMKVWTQLLAQHAGVIWQHRQLLMQYLQDHLVQLYNELFDEEYPFEVRLLVGADSVEGYEEQLQASWPYEQRYQYTLYGPHRDDLEITVDGRPVSAVLSRGQMRSLVITLKVAAFHYMKQVLGESPLLLFDEVLSELDEGRQRTLLSHLPSSQTLLTGTSIPQGVRRQDGVYVLNLETIIGKQVGQEKDDHREGEDKDTHNEHQDDHTVEVVDEVGREPEVVTIQR